MPAAENTNNFWNLGGEKRGLPRVAPPRPGFFNPRLRRLPQTLKKGLMPTNYTEYVKFGWTCAVVSQTLLFATLASFSSLARRGPDCGTKADICYLRADSFSAGLGG